MQKYVPSFSNKRGHNIFSNPMNNKMISNNNQSRSTKYEFAALSVNTINHITIFGN